MSVLDLQGSRKTIENFIASDNKSTAEDRLKVLNILVKLKENTITKDDLTSSKIGISVNKLRKIEDEEIQKASTELLMQWKDLMLPPKRKLDTTVEDGEAEEGIKSESKSGTKEVKADSDSKLSEGPSKKDVNSSSASASAESVKKTNSDGSNVFDYFIGDSVRDKCLEMLVKALMTDQLEGTNPDELVINTAQSIERALFNEFKSTSPAYKAKMRSKYLNLLDKNNPTLRNGLVSGMISADRFIAMSSAEMASDERRRVDSMIAEQNLLNSQMAKDNSAETDQFKCGRCNQRKCKYYQMQTRSADEPMTTFVTCVNCGNRWRFC